MELKKEDYVLSFWVRGVSVFVTDIHAEIYRKLEGLFIIDHGMFKQYFAKKAYERALDLGVEFYSDKDAFPNYQKELSSLCVDFKNFYESEIKGHGTLSREKVITFFEYTKKLCGGYTQMNSESTDLAFSQQENNPIIKKNLAKVALFKDTVRSFMNIVLFESDGYLSNLFNILGRQFGLSPSILENMTQGEILDLFENKKPVGSRISKRQEAFVEGFGIEGFYEGEDAENILREFKEDLSRVDFIQGQTASKGKVSGRVKIIPVDYGDLGRINTEINNMQQGDILVAETTAPELILACKKASAIVTDIGGLMSHAAIVSRELGIPCIVGTKIATQVLKDGDMIDVDASKGIVRKLGE